MMTDTIGAQGIIDIGASARSEIGTKINCVHDWCLGAVAFGMGRCGLLALEAIGPDDYVEESNIILKFMQRVLWGKRQDGLILNSQDRYRCQIHDQDFIDQLMSQVVDFEEGSRGLHAGSPQFNATAELLAFFDHYDCRLGLGDTGPYPLPDGRLLIIRDLFVNEPVYHWRDVCDELPHCYTLAVVIDPDEAGPRRDPGQRHLHHVHRPQELHPGHHRRCDLRPREVGHARWARSTRSSSPSSSRTWRRSGRRPSKMYDKTVGWPAASCAPTASSSYYIDMFLPYLRKAGIYEEVCSPKYDFWEIDQRVANYYYEITKRNFVQVTVPQKIFSGEGYLPFSDDADLRVQQVRLDLSPAAACRPVARTGRHAPPASAFLNGSERWNRWTTCPSWSSTRCTCARSPTADMLAECSGVPPPTSRSALDARRWAEAGLVEDLGGQFMLSDDGRQGGARLLRGRLRASCAATRTSRTGTSGSRPSTTGSSLVSAWQASR